MKEKLKNFIEDNLELDQRFFMDDPDPFIAWKKSIDDVEERMANDILEFINKNK